MLPININELLEQNRIESKQGWNPAAIYNMFIDEKNTMINNN